MFLKKHWCGRTGQLIEEISTLVPFLVREIKIKIFASNSI